LNVPAFGALVAEAQHAHNKYQCECVLLLTYLTSKLKQVVTVTMATGNIFAEHRLFNSVRRVARHGSLGSHESLPERHLD